MIDSRVNGPKDVFAGLIFVAIGIGTFLLARDYEIGSAIDMGPGYFPSVVALVLVLVGLLAIVRGLTRKTRDPITAHRIEPLILVFASILAFSLLIETAGLLVASAALIGISCFRRLLTNPFEVLAIYFVLTGFCVVVFVEWFDMQLPLVGWN